MTKEIAPAFQFYPRDFLADGDQAALSLEQVGAYMRMLSHAWLKRGLDDDPDKIARMIGGEVEVVSVVLREHFKRAETAEGHRWVNPRQEDERKKQAKYRKQQQLKGIASANRRSTTVQPRLDHGSTTVQPEGNSASASASSSSTVVQNPHGPRKRRQRNLFEDDDPSTAAWLYRSWPVWFSEERHGAKIVMKKVKDKDTAKAIAETWTDRAYLEKLGRAFLSSSSDRLKWCPERTLAQFASSAAGIDAWMRSA